MHINKYLSHQYFSVSHQPFAQRGGGIQVQRHKPGLLQLFSFHHSMWRTLPLHCPIFSRVQYIGEGKLCLRKTIENIFLFLWQYRFLDHGVDHSSVIEGKRFTLYFFAVDSLHCKKKVSDFPVPSRDVTNRYLFYSVDLPLHVLCRLSP